MLGTFKSLTRPLEIIEYYWKSKEDEDLEVALPDIFHGINLYLEKHNYSQLVKQSLHLNNQLCQIYQKYIKDSGGLNREVQFLKVLMALLPALGDEIIPWVKCYLGPALDSGGYNLHLVLEARRCIHILISEVRNIEEKLFLEKREDIRIKIVNMLVQLYVCGDEHRIKFLKLDINDEEKGTQLFCERMRYLKANCSDMLYEFGLEYGETYFRILNSYYLKPDQRLDVLTLLSRISCSSSSQVCKITLTDLFKNVLRTLLYDFDSMVIHVSLSLLVILIPQILEEAKLFFPEFLFIYIRMVAWRTLDNLYSERKTHLLDLLNQYEIRWEPTKLMMDVNSLHSPILLLIEFDVRPLITLLYGLVPMNVIQFSNSPRSFLLETENFLEDSLNLCEMFHLLDDDYKSKQLMNDIKTFTKNYLKSFYLHPCIVNNGFTSLEEELWNPRSSILENDTREYSAEEVALKCFELNPNLKVNIFSKNTDANSTSQCDSPFLLGAVSGTEKIRHQTLPFPRVPSSNNSLASSTELTAFRNTDATGRPVSVEGSPSLKKFESGHYRDVLGSLLFDHERLYSLSNGERNEKSSNTSIISSSTLTEKSPQDLSKSMQERDTISEIKENLKGSENSSKDNHLHGSEVSNRSPDYTVMGNSLDFYNRELLIMKNELEFALYIKNLLRYQNTKLKLEANELKREIETCSVSNLDGRSSTELLELESDNIALKECVERLQSQVKSIGAFHKIQNERLTKAYQELQEKYNSMREHFETHNQKLDSQSKELDLILKHSLPDRDLEIKRLEHKVASLELEVDRRISKRDFHKEDINPSPTTFLSEKEVENVALKTELSISQQETLKAKKDIKRLQELNDTLYSGYEMKVSHLKSEFQSQIASYTALRDKRLKDLLVTLRKYEALLEEKNSKIVQLSTSKPIPIPGGPSADNSHDYSKDATFSSTSIDNPFSTYVQSNKKSSNSSLNGAQTPQVISNPLPMTSGNANHYVRGRGGIQNRSKKFM